jgi:PAS domain-containing protein
LKNRRPKKPEKPQPRPKSLRRKAVNVTLPQIRIDQVHAFHDVRCKTDDDPPRLCTIWRELLETGIEFTDPKTGRRKPALTASSTLTVSGQPGFWKLFPLFDRYELDDVDLIRAMDESWMMLWAARPDNAHLHANPILQQYTGRAASEFRQLNWVEVIHPEDQERILQATMEGFRRRQPFRLAYRMRRYDGCYGGIIDHAQPRFRPDGSFGGYIGTAYQIAPPGTSVEVLVYDQISWTFQERLIVNAGPPAERAAGHR